MSTYVPGHASHPRSAFPEVSEQPLVRRGAAKRIVVIGAGMAGLCAAYELARAGHEVTILEARSRVGGRVHTMRKPFSDGLHAEIGGMFLLGHHNLPIGYALHFGLQLTSMTAPGTLYYMDGRRIVNTNDPLAPWPVTLSPDEQKGGLAGLFIKYLLGAATQNFGDPRSADWPPATVAKFDTMTMADFLRSQGASQGAVDILKLGYFAAWGEGLDWASTLLILRDLALTNDGIPPGLVFSVLPALRGGKPIGDDMVRRKSDEVVAQGTLATPPFAFQIAGGNDLLPHAFAASRELAGSIRLNTAVTRIEDTGDGLMLSCVNGTTHSEVEAERVICTVPFSVLRTMELALPISVPKRRAIDRLEYASVCRTYVQTRTRFWETLKVPPEAATDLFDIVINNQTVVQPGTRGILEAFTAGPNARLFESWPEAERVARATSAMATALGASESDFEGGASYSWTQDPWARGGYAWFLPGDMQMLMPYIAPAEGRLHFAGDHTSVLPGWIQGALESGLRAADEVNTAP